MKIVLYALSALLLAASSSHAGLIITAVVDTPSGSHPRVIEVMATASINTADYWYVRQTNGGGNISSSNFSSVSLNAGDFAYISTGSDSTDFLNDNNVGPILLDGIADGVSSWNGDDILGISSSDQSFAAGTENASDLTNMVDSFGLFGQADTDFYADSIALRQSTSVTGTGNGIFDATNFDMTGLTSASNAESTALANFGQFTAVPEPSSLTYGLIFAMTAFGPRRRR